MKLLAFDQAVHCTGYAFSIDGQLHSFDAIKRTRKTVSSPAEMALSPQRWMKQQMRSLIVQLRPDVVALEMVHLGGDSRENVSTLITLAEFRGKCAGMIEDLGIRVLDIASFEVMGYLHLSIGTNRTRKKERAQFFATADAYSNAVASMGPLLSEDVADAIIILRVAEGRIKQQQWEALANTEEYRMRRTARKRASRQAVR